MTNQSVKQRSAAQEAKHLVDKIQALRDMVNKGDLPDTFIKDIEGAWLLSDELRSIKSSLNIIIDYLS